VKLPDRTDILAKAGAAKKAVDEKGSDEIADDDPGGEPRAIPETESLVAPKIKQDQSSG
jgi:hypothetical protein